MKRLTYAPKAYVFIRSANQKGTIFDVSSDVVSGSVTQNVNDLSKATFQLRNRYQKWIRDPNTKKSIFLPMDLVTIWLQRVAGRPIQVFTGYLDSVPYYQGYPGDVTFTASCTLKKLAYTWFDPGLEFFNTWVLATGGWYYDPSSGEAVNPEYNWGNADVGKEGIDTRDLHDGGFAELLGRFMLDIAGWGPNDVLISELPKDLPKIAGKLYNQMHDPVDTDLKALSEFLGQAMGVPGFSAATDQTPEITADGKQAQGDKSIAISKAMVKSATKHNIPAIVLSLAAYLQTGYREQYKNENNDGSVNGEWYGYGIYAMRPTAGAPGGGGGHQPQKIEGFTIEQILSIGNASEAYCRRLVATKTDELVKGARKNDTKSIVQWIIKANGRPLRNITNQATAFATAKKYLLSAVVVTPTTTPSIVIEVNSLNWIDPRLLNLVPANTAERKIVNEYNNRLVESWLTGWLWRAKQLTPKLTLANPTKDYKGTTYITLTGPPTKLKAYWKTIKGDVLIDWAQINVSDQQETLKGGSVSTPTPVVRGQSGYLGTANNTIVVQQKKAPPKGTTTGGPGASLDSSASDTAGTPTGGATFEQLAAFSANSAFAANFAFPSDRIESTFLTGNRALMNDVSCFDGMKQFCQGSMRAFRSLPDGRFLAFYPDYFGAYRKPYWSISDIEIINMGIQLNDEALATHVYVTGDTFALDGQIDFLDRASTRGVATLTQSFMLDSILVRYDDKKDDPGISRIHRLKDAFDFLQHYGARPHAEEQPLIRNTAYEFLMAWQRFGQLWASTFATTVDFTFQPEVMAGGLIAFPDHKLQMYCENVTHTFSYESGFSTQATMSSPAHTGDHKDSDSKPGFALAGGINSVGAG